jgi:hypothetical protein
MNAEAAKTKAMEIVEKLFFDISDRRGLKRYFFGEIDEDVRENHIRSEWEATIAKALTTPRRGFFRACLQMMRGRG